MFSPILFRYSKPSSCLVLLFLIFCSFNHLPCTLSQEGPGSCDTSFSCGNITAGFPFWGELRPELCGHPFLGLRCDRSSNRTFLIISDLMYRVLEINTTINTTLRVARQDFLGDFCLASFSSATLTPELFEILPDYKTLAVHYLCDAYIYYNASFICQQRGIGSMDQNDETHKHCAASFNINVPRSYVPEEADLDLKHLQSVLEQGFVVKLRIDERPCQECQSTGGVCYYRNNATQVCCKTHSSSEEIICLPMTSSDSRDTKLLSFFYKCRDPEVGLPPNGTIIQLNCEDNSFERSYVVVFPSHEGIRPTLDALNASCKRNINIAVSRFALGIAETNKSVDDIKKAIEGGFELKFNSNCSRCLDSRGYCGYNKSSTAFVCYCIDEPHEHTCFADNKSVAPTSAKSSISHNGRIGIGLACGMLGFIGIAGLIICKVLSSRHRKIENSHHPIHHDLKALIPLKHYNYTEVKKITKSFSHIIGKGGFGTVYKGILSDGRKVAVKVLKDTNSNGEDFINEVASISQTSHVNIVSLLGFCYEGCNRAIVYEFLENGSLDHFISTKKLPNLDMNTLYGIALGVARGLEYLHYGCKTRIVHFDIKPQNVLLDNNLSPKVSDFGLAKLCEKRESVMSLVETRGTIGYIAPEVFSRMYGVISHKSDVYSYGMLILDMIGARNREIEENVASNTSSTYFPDWIYKNVEKGEYKGILGDEISEEEKDIGQKMILVGLWCIQPRPSDRPPMNKVVEMLEESLDTLQVPPKPVLQSPEASLTSSKESTVYSEV